MLRKFVFAVASSVLLVCAASCGDDGKQTEFSLAATIDGAKFSANAVQAFTDPVFVTISGSSSTQLMILHLDVPAVPGTVAIADTSLDGNYASVTENGVTWSTLYGGTGTAVFTTTNANEASGTFTFVAVAEPNAALAARTVTAGTFTVRFAH